MSAKGPEPTIHLFVSSPRTFSHREPLPPNTVQSLATEVHNDQYHFGWHHHQEVVRVLSRFLKVSSVPAPVVRALQHCQGVQLPPQEQLLAWVPSELLNTLYDYQREGVAFAVAHGGRCMIADEMGVGKSLQGLAVLSTFRREWPALLLCPSSLKGQWRDLAAQWLPGVHVRVAQKGTDPLDGELNIVSYVPGPRR